MQMASTKGNVELVPIEDLEIEDGELCLLSPNADGKPSIGYRKRGAWTDYYTDEQLEPERGASLRLIGG